MALVLHWRSAPQPKPEEPQPQIAAPGPVYVPPKTATQQMGVFADRRMSE